MTRANASTITDYLATLDPMRTTALIIGVLVAHLALALLLHYATRTARARAREGARAWADVKRVEWSARAQGRADHTRERATPQARRARRAHLALAAGALGVVIVAVAATNLSAHGIQARLDDVGLGALDARVSVFLVFEGLLALAGGLSFWHQVTGRAGIDRYAVGMWIVSGLMAYLAAWGGDSPLFGVFPIIAAVAWHELVAAEAKRRGKYRGILGRGATDEDTDAVDAQRRLSRIVARAVRANTGPRALRWLWARLYLRALDEADARGLLTDEARAQLAARTAARYAGAAALSPEAVAAANPWTQAAAPAAPDPAPVPEPAAPRTPVARVVESAPARLQLVAEAAPVDDVRALIESHQACPPYARAWVADFWEAHGTMPTGVQLVGEFGGHPGACRKWVSGLKQALRQAA
jgi:hypothetical protein